MRAGSLFTGTAALDMAADAVFGPADLAWYSDVKPAAVALLAHRFPGVPNLGDLTAAFPVDRSPDLLGPDGRPLDLMDPARWLPVTAQVAPVDRLTFGWPCQPHSSAGKRLGEDDPRALLPNVVRAVAHLRPRILLGENVARVTTNGELRRAVRALAALGYVGAWRCLPASDVGAPHKRDRVALLAVRADAVSDAVRVGLGPHVDDVPAREPDAARRGALTLLPTPTQNMTTGPGRQGREGGMNLQTAAVTLLPTPRPQTKGGGSDPDEGWLRRKAENPNIGGPNLVTAVVHEQLRTDGHWGVYADAVHRWEQVLGRPAPDPTIPSPRTGGPQLSPWFVEWMMGLPAGWVCDVPGLAPRPSGWRNAALSLLGDGVVWQQLAHGYRLAAADLAETWAGESVA